jgi:hypothetical protein
MKIAMKKVIEASSDMNIPTKLVKQGGCCFLRLTKSQKVCIVLAKQDGVAVEAR